MRVFLSALSGLAISGGVIAPLVTQNNSLVNKSNVSPHTEFRVDLNGVKKMTVEQGEKTWSKK